MRTFSLPRDAGSYAGPPAPRDRSSLYSSGRWSLMPSDATLTLISVVRGVSRLPLQRRYQAQVVQHRRPQQQRNVANHRHAFSASRRSECISSCSPRHRQPIARLAHIADAEEQRRQRLGLLHREARGRYCVSPLAHPLALADKILSFAPRLNYFLQPLPGLALQLQNAVCAEPGQENPH